MKTGKRADERRNTEKEKTLPHDAEREGFYAWSTGSVKQELNGIIWKLEAEGVKELFARMEIIEALYKAKAHQEAGLTQQQLAEKMGTNRTYIAAVERGRKVVNIFEKEFGKPAVIHDRKRFSNLQKGIKNE